MTEGFRRDSERVLHRGPVISVAEGTFSAPDGTTFERQVVHHPGAVSVVPLIDPDTVVLVRQYRAAIDAPLLEIPAGKRDEADEPPEETAARELVEEVGLRPGTLELLAEFHNSPGFSDEHSLVYLGTDLVTADRTPHGIEEEHLEVVHVPLDDVDGMIASGELRDAKTIIGLLTARRRLGR